MAQGASLLGKCPVTINHIPTCGQELAQLRDAGRSSREMPGAELSADGAQHTAAQCPGEGWLLQQVRHQTLLVMGVPEQDTLVPLMN